eukprot:gene13026-14285_t
MAKIGLLLFLHLFIIAIAIRQTTLKLINNAGHPIDLLWFDEETKVAVSQLPAPLPNASEAVIDTYEHHQFIIRLLDNQKDANHLETFFTKQLNDETVIVHYNEKTNNLTLTIPDEYDWLRKKIHKLVQTTCSSDNINNNEDDKNDFSSCIRENIALHVKHVHESKNNLRKFQDDISSKLRNYTCDDDNLSTTTPDYIYPMNIDGKSYDINVLLDLTHAKIWYVNNFITPEECDLLEKHGRPKLTRATVAAEDGTSVVSEHRKAQQALYDLHSIHGEADPLWKLHKRILTLTNQHGNYTLDTPGQEGFTIIQYNPGDEYFPHCDGSCDNTPHVKTGRIATAVLYCKAPEKGGATVFTRSNILVRPKLGSATFFSYKGADGRMDDGYTEHTGCPVKEGEKLITTFWMRDGVTYEDNWTLYDPSGVRILESQTN